MSARPIFLEWLIAVACATYVLVTMTGCEEPDAAEFRRCGECRDDEVCPVETGVCAPTCVDYDDCFGVGDGHCAYLADGPACVWHCGGDTETPDGFVCEGLEDEGTVLRSDDAP